MIQEPLKLEVGGETLSGAIFSNHNKSILPQFVFLHGGGVSTKESIKKIASPILTRNMNILSFDFSGQGESTGELKKSSLEKRTNEANAIIKHFSANKNLIVCGSSMGGYVAIKMLEFCPVDTLILLCPALYDKKAYPVRFDLGFTEIIRKPYSWRESDALSLLQKFTGKLLIVIGDKDEIIPTDVIHLLTDHTPNAQKKEVYIIPDCPHQMFAWFNEHKKELLKLEEKIIEYIS